jgi:TolB protein
MTERWQVRLRPLNELSPEDDLFERASRGPRRDVGPSRSSKAVAIALGLGVSVALVVAAVAVLGARNRGPSPGSSVTGATGDATTTPSNGDLLYAKRVDDGWSLFTLDPETGAERQITHGYRDYGSDWSPDGRQVVYDSETRDGHEGIWVANADGSDAREVVQDGSVPEWSPDGTQIVFARAEPGRTVQLSDGVAATPSYLYVMRADGTDVRRLTEGDFSDYSPVWSPDGTQIAFERLGREQSGLFVMRVDGSDVRQLASGLEIFSAPAWGSNGEIAIAVNGTKDGAPGGIVLVAADGSGTLQMVPGSEVDYPDYVSDPTWSPDGEWLAYVRGYRGEIAITRADGSDTRTLRIDPGQDSIEELSWGVAASP